MSDKTPKLQLNRAAPAAFGTAQGGTPQLRKVQGNVAPKAKRSVQTMSLEEFEAKCRQDMMYTAEAFAQWDAPENQAFLRPYDTPHWVCLVFQSRDNKQMFLSFMGWGARGDKYLCGEIAANELGIDPPLPLPKGMQQIAALNMQRDRSATLGKVAAGLELQHAAAEEPELDPDRAAKIAAAKQAIADYNSWANQEVDSEYWITLAFQTPEARDAFLTHTGWGEPGTQFVCGELASYLWGADLPYEIPAPLKPKAPKPRLIALVRE